MKPPLCLNMIVKNEAPRIERCLNSVLPYVQTAVIMDTGSTDNTIELIRAICKAHSVPVVIDTCEFKNFSQARNAAFAFAQENIKYRFTQFALLVDADMELVVEDQAAFASLDANASSYDMMQKAGSMSYANRRLINLVRVTDPYVGATHEYIDVAAAGMITGARFIDHADGSNRVDKYPRDEKLLIEALKKNPQDGRALYYLANTYRDWGKPKQAAAEYQLRINQGGWDEETYSAMMNLADCQKALGNRNNYVGLMVKAFNFRPRRAEPLYELAKFYREKGMNAAALLYAKRGLDIPRPNDLLFVNDFVYSHGLRYEYSIVAFYAEAERDRALEVTNDLALDPTCPASERNSARNNLFWYTKPLKQFCPSFTPKRLAFQPSFGYTAMNPSVVECNGKITCNIRCVNYKIDEHGRYMIGPKECNDAPIDTRNVLVEITPDLTVRGFMRELFWDRETPNFNMVTGLEDIRLWFYCGTLHFNATVRERSMFGTCQQITGIIRNDPVDAGYCTVVDALVVSGDEQHEKNWMPMPSRPFAAPRFIYRLDTTIEPRTVCGTAERTEKFEIDVLPDNISGGSQAIPFKGGLLAVVHEAANGPDGKRTYWHRFAYFGSDGQFRKLSKPFVLLDRQIEFCAGLCPHPNLKDLILSFGVRDEEAWLATVSAEEVAIFLWSKS